MAVPEQLSFLYSLSFPYAQAAHNQFLRHTLLSYLSFSTASRSASPLILIFRAVAAMKSNVACTRQEMAHHCLLSKIPSVLLSLFQIPPTPSSSTVVFTLHGGAFCRF
jgi:hypothetical protein